MRSPQLAESKSMRHSERLVGVRGDAGLLTLVAALVVGPVAAEPLSFAAALVRLESHPTLEASQAQGRAATAVRDSARALRFPQVGLSGTYGRFSDPVELDLGELNAKIHELNPAIPTIPNLVLQPESFGFATATLAWPVFTGGRIDAAQRAGEAGIRVSDAQREATRDALLLDLVTRYHGATIAARAAAVQDSVVDSLREHLRHARTLENQGQIAAVERMRAEVALAQAEALQLQRRHVLALARAGLANLLGTGQDVDPTTILTQVPPPPVLATLQTTASQTHPLPQQLQAVTAQAEQGVRVARADYWPTIALLGGYKIDSYQLPELIPEWTVGATLTWPLFDGGARSAKVAGARAKLIEAQALQREAADKVGLLVHERYLAQEDAGRRAEVAERTEALASESLRLQRVAFREGMGRSIDVVDAENALATARLARLAADYDSAVAWAGLMLAAGHRHEVERVFSHSGPEAEPDVE